MKIKNSNIELPANVATLCKDIREASPEMAEHVVVFEYLSGKTSLTLESQFVESATAEAVRLLNPTLRQEPNLESIAQQIRMVHLFDLNTKLCATGRYATTTIISDDSVKLIVTLA